MVVADRVTDVAIAIASRMAQRAPAYNSLLDMTLATKPNYQVAEMHRIIAEHLEAVERGEIDRLLIETPPRHGKSELVSVRLPAWYLGRNPDKRVIAASHTAHLARRFGRQSRNLLQHPEYQKAFPGISTADDSSAKDEWDISGHEGGYIAAGVGGPITGSGADLAIIDDPVKNRQQADSPVSREHTWDWYNDVLVTRLEGRGAIILTMTRWHQDDLAGRLLESEPERWTVLRLPALADHEDPLGREVGEALWPEKFSAGYLRDLQQTDIDFDALYQQNPTARHGASFHREWFSEMRYDTTDIAWRNKSFGRWISWDTAMKDKASSDYSAAAVWELQPDYSVNLREVWRGRLTFPDLPSTIEDLARRYNRDDKLKGVIIEDRGSGISAFQTLMHSSPDWLRPLLVAFEPTGSKEYRAGLASVFARNQCIRLPQPSEDVPWLLDFEQELFSFPSVQHDDQVDAFTQGILWLENYLTAGRDLRNEHLTEMAARSA